MKTLLKNRNSFLNKRSDFIVGSLFLRPGCTDADTCHESPGFLMRRK